MKHTFTPARIGLILGVSLLATLAACAKPVTNAPKLEASQIAAERALQAQMLNQAQASSSAAPITMLPRAEILARLNRVAPRIQQSGTEICQKMWGDKKPCSFSFTLSEDDVLNAWADGKGVYITAKMVSFAASDENLANVLAHEYAHNVLTHPQSTGKNAAAGALGGMLLDALANSQGLDTGGQLSKLGAKHAALHYSVAFEKEADYVGLYILAHAGYQVDGAMGFWRQFTLQDPNGLYGSQSHPSNPERTLSMQKTVQEIAAKRAANQPLLPDMRKK